MMTKPVVEIVARAIARSEYGSAGECQAADYLDHARAALIDIDAAGYIIVPKEPSRVMIEAGNGEAENQMEHDWDSGSDGESHNSYTYLRSDAVRPIYKAMIAVAAAEDQS